MYLSLLILPLGYPLMWLFSLPSVAAFGVSFLVWAGVFFLFNKSWPAKFLLKEGCLTITDDKVQVRMDETETHLPLDSSTTVEITYQGFQGERLTNRIRASGFDNFIQFNEGETYRFEVLNEQAEQELRRELRRWYLLKVKVKEHRRDAQTFLLHRDLSYEQIQAYKQDFDVSLYG